MLGLTNFSAKNVFKGIDFLTSKTNNLVHDPLTEKIFYLHIHKCGGYRLNKRFRRVIGL